MELSLGFVYVLIRLLLYTFAAFHIDFSPEKAHRKKYEFISWVIDVCLMVIMIFRFTSHRSGNP